MSFGFSVGDFLAVGKLIADITSSLKEVGGSKSIYRDVVLELECLQKALVHLDRLQPPSNSQTVDSIKYAALSCKRPLEEFLTKLRRYEASLGPRATAGSSWKAPIDKVRFMATQNDDIRRMQSYLSVHVGTLNILLAEHGLETMNLAQEKTAADQVDIRERIETTKGVLVQVRDSVARQAAAVYNTAGLLEKLYNMVSGEIHASWKALEGMVAAACVSTTQIYGVVVEIRSALLSRPDTRWTFLQDPVFVEDALGRKFPVPSEYDFALLDRIIQHKFERGPGSTQVSHGDYQIMDARDRKLALPSQSHLRPGSSLIMAILIGKPPPGILTDQACPMPRCASDKTTEAEGGGRICCTCGIWFSETDQKRKSLFDLWAAARESLQTHSSDSRQASSTLKRTSDDDPTFDVGGPSRKRQKSAAYSDEADFKYVRLADIDGPASPDSILSLENDDESLGVHAQTVARSIPTTKDAVRYLDEIRAVYRERPEQYNEFLDIMKDFKAFVIDTSGVINRVTELFWGSMSDGIPAKDLESLTNGLNDWLPLGYRMEIPAERLHTRDIVL